jgi:hypothetical protein
MALKGKQHKLDKNKNGRIDGEDFKMMKKGGRVAKKKGGRIAKKVGGRVKKMGGGMMKENPMAKQSMYKRGGRVR